MDRQVTVVYVTVYNGSLYAHAFNRNGIEVTLHFKQHLEARSLSIIERVMRHEANQQPISWVTDASVVADLGEEIGLNVRYDVNSSGLLRK